MFGSLLFIWRDIFEQMFNGQADRREKSHKSLHQKIDDATKNYMSDNRILCAYLGVLKLTSNSFGKIKYMRNEIIRYLFAYMSFSI